MKNAKKSSKNGNIKSCLWCSVLIARIFLEVKLLYKVYDHFECFETINCFFKNRRIVFLKTDQNSALYLYHIPQHTNLRWKSMKSSLNWSSSTFPTLWRLLKLDCIKQEKEDGPLCKFYEVIMDLGANNQYLNELTLAKDVTLFAPSNEAWNDISVQNILR